MADGRFAGILGRGECTGNNPAPDITWDTGAVLTADPAQRPLEIGLSRGLLQVRAQGTQRVTAELFSLNGRKVFEAAGFGGRLSALALSDGRPPANGVYPAAVTVEKWDGTITQELRKSVVVR